MPMSWPCQMWRPWWPLWLIRARALPSRSSRSGRNEFKVVLGPSRKTPLSATILRMRSWRACPSWPASANPAAKIITKSGCLATTSSRMVTGSPAAMTARSTGPSMSWMDR